jgi:CBS domain-containing protein
LKVKKVRDIMIRDITAVSEDTTLKEVAKILARIRVSGIPVVNDKHEVIGFISEADIIHSVAPSKGRGVEFFLHNFAELTRKMSQVGEKKVKDYMSKKVELVSEDEDIYTLADLMLRRNYKILPVVREKRLVGVVSRAEVCRALMEEREEEEK